MITLVLPLPPKELYPNWRGHWAAKHKAVAAYRMECGYEALRQAPQRWGVATIGRAVVSTEVTPALPITADVEFWHKDNYRRDEDNCRAALKACWDGLVDAKFLARDDTTVFRQGKCDVYYKEAVEWVRPPKEAPCVVVRLYHAGERE